MITIDGAAGEGGGQILRSALSLSMITGQPFRIERIRAGREKPGLMRQHLTAVMAATQICGAQVKGAAPASTELDFTPGAIRGGDYRIAIGTAGSTTLVLQTLLPALLHAREPSRLVLEGGTHNPHAPSFEFLAQSFLPLLARMGPAVTAKLVRSGFYPAGGGQIEIEVSPAGKLAPLHVGPRGALRATRAEALVVNLPGSIAERELAVIAAQLRWPAESLHLRSLKAIGPGNVLTLYLEFDNITQVVVGFGEQGVAAEAIAARVARTVQRLLAGEAAVDPHLADQLLLPMALAGGGSFSTLKPSLHTRTNIDIIRRFIDLPIEVTEAGRDLHELRVGA
jgi:RNA 3'-terminal phosphate cyclase (ATP)